VVVVVTSLRGGGEDDEKKKHPDRNKEKKSIAISFCSMGGLTSPFKLAMLSGAKEAILFLSKYLWGTITGTAPTSERNRQRRELRSRFLCVFRGCSSLAIAGSMWH
jgi:hypothetical protein